jgi:predicted RecA/RadA family phage recombinase
MAALSDNIEIQEKDGIVHAAPVAVDIIYRGAMVVYNTAGYLAPASTSAGVIFAGIALEKVDNSGGSAGDLNCKYVKEGIFLLTGSGLAQSDVGEQVYASDDQTITKTSTNNAPVGKIVEYVSSTQVWVKLDRNPAAAA